jgi:hypothetical protein
MPRTHSILRVGLRKYFGRWAGASATMPIVLAAISFAPVGAALAAPCTGPGAPTTTQTECLTAVQIPGNALRSFDISWDDADRAEYYLGDRSNAGIDIIDTEHNTFKRTIGGFVGIKLLGSGAVDNNHSGPDGVVSHGRWLYAGDGDSTLKVIDLNAPTASAIKQTLSTGGTTRVDEMALTTDGKLLLVANNAEDPPFGTLFNANGDASTSNVSKVTKITVDNTIIPAGLGLSIEQPTWEPKTARFYVSIPQINNPTGCVPFSTGSNQCNGGLLVIDPTTLSTPTAVIGAFNSTTNTGVLPLNQCGPNGATVGPHENLLLGCTPANLPGSTTTLVINAKTKNFANIGGITGSDEVWFNAGDSRYYTGSSAAIKPTGSPLGSGAVLGVIDGTSVLIETIPQSSGSHSVAADCKRNKIFVPQVAPVAVVGAGGDTNTTAGPGSPTVGSLICGSNNGCVAVYIHETDDEDQQDNQDNACQTNDHQKDHHD